LRFARLLKAEDFRAGLNGWLTRFIFLGTAEGAKGAEEGEKRDRRCLFWGVISF